MVALATQVPEGLSALLNEITLEALAKRPHRASSSRGRTGDNRRQSGPPTGGRWDHPGEVDEPLAHQGERLVGLAGVACLDP